MNVLIGYMIDGRNSGIDKYILRVLDILARENVHADILTGKDNPELRHVLSPYGAEVFEVPGLMHPKAQYAAMKKILRAGHYDAAYFNISEPMNCIGAKSAHKLGVPRVIIHSHNTAQGETNPTKAKLKSMLNRMARPRLKTYGTGFYACSQAAGKWLFPQSVLDSKDYHVLYNPIPVEEFAFDPSIRGETREALGLGDACVVGHVGNFVPAKNSIFLLEILSALRKTIPNAVLLSVGDGPERQQVTERAKEMGLEDAAVFLGIRDDVPRLLQAMDFFVLPSLFEGLPVSAIEAQMAGLRSFLSDRITTEVKLSDACSFLPIQEGGQRWAEAMAEAWPYDRRDFRQCRAEIRPFDLQQQTDEIISIFR